MKCPICGSEMSWGFGVNQNLWFCPVHKHMFDLNDLQARKGDQTIFSFGDKSVGGGTIPCVIGDKREYVMVFGDFDHLARWSCNHAMKGMFIQHDDEFASGERGLRDDLLP